MLHIILSIENEEEYGTAEFIWNQYQSYMYLIALKILKKRNDAEDAVMDAIQNIVNHIRHFVGLPEKDTVCLITIYVKNAAFKIYNKNKRTAEYVIGSENNIFIDEHIQIDATVITKCEYEKIAEHLRNMPEKYSYPFILRHYYGFSVKDIMESLDLSESTVKKRLVRAKQQLLKLVENDHE